MMAAVTLAATVSRKVLDAFREDVLRETAPDLRFLGFG